MVIATQHNLELEQMNVKTILLHGDLEYIIYKEKCESFVEEKSKYAY